MKWVTREKVKVDRGACPWLIKNFVDSNAEFVFVPHDTDWSRIQDGIGASPIACASSSRLASGV